jgi:biopolymer transport protein ExbB
MLEKLTFYMTSGGYVMVPLALSSLIIWYGIGYRWSVLRRPNQRSVRRLIQKCRKGELPRRRGLIENAVVRSVAAAEKRPVNLRRQLDDVLADDETELSRYARLVTALVAVAPILGLLGTVNGMIETFQALGDMALFAQSTSIAGGISQALFTTQLGLGVAIPGLVVNGLLNRRAREMELELTQIKDILCAADSGPHEEAGA